MPFPIKLNQCTPWDKLQNSDKNLEGLSLIQDPFDLRSKILPIITKTNPNTWKGLGTAFKIDSFGTLMSAEHIFRDPDVKTACIVMESMGIVYGKYKIPQECYTPLSYRASLSYEKDNPMPVLSGGTKEKHFFYDIVAITSHPHKTKKCSAPFKVNLNKNAISEGDKVMAIGYPQIGDLSDINEVYNEKLMCAVGTITEIYKTGRHDGEKYPSFQVDANWSSGMSGSPVFNEEGHVVGIISRSTKCDYGIAVALPYCKDNFFNAAFPSLDLLNPGWQKGWAIIRKSPWHFAGIFKSELEAKKYKIEHDLISTHEIEYGSNEVGTDNFIY